MQTTKTIAPKKLENLQKSSWKEKCWQWLGFTGVPTIKIYAGYGHAAQMVIYGHALSFAPLRRKKYRSFLLRNIIGLIRLFIVRQIPDTKVQLYWNDQVFISVTESDGFIHQDWHSAIPIPYGWNDVKVEILDNADQPIAHVNGKVLVPHSTQYAFISDIDDTFLISHSTNLRKRLSLLFTRNPRTRKPFEGVVNHYNLLAAAHTAEDEQNPFFYVSSSEWNLYDYIDEFIVRNGLPKGVVLLSKMKKLGELLSTGQNNHQTKFARISRILNAFPKQRFVLLGDSSQQDPFIYADIVTHFPGRIFAVYIRDIAKKKSNEAQAILHKMESAGVACCFFVHSIEAVAHSKMIGLIR